MNGIVIFVKKPMIKPIKKQPISRHWTHLRHSRFSNRDCLKLPHKNVIKQAESYLIWFILYVNLIGDVRST